MNLFTCATLSKDALRATGSESLNRINISRLRGSNVLEKTQFWTIGIKQVSLLQSIVFLNHYSLSTQNNIPYSWITLAPTLGTIGNIWWLDKRSHVITCLFTNDILLPGSFNVNATRDTLIGYVTSIRPIASRYIHRNSSVSFQFDRQMTYW